MSNPFVQVEQSKLYYTKTGTGSKNLLAFHGFGQTHEVFSRLADSLSSAYTLYIFDLFFHGKSEWNNTEQALEKAFWKRLIENLMEQQSIQSFSVLGFSMGGKFALATLEAFPHQTKEVFLIAPDGIKTSMWYSLATYPTVFRDLFKSMISKPERFNALANSAGKLGLIDKGILRFVETQMNTEEKRKRVYFSWVVFRHLKFNTTAIAELINQNKIRLVMIVGKFDKIITIRNMNTLLRKVNTYAFETPETGHNGIIDASIPILKKH